MCYGWEDILGEDVYINCKSTLAAKSWAMIKAVESGELVKTQTQQSFYSSDHRKYMHSDSEVVCWTVLTDCNSLHDTLHSTKNVGYRGVSTSIKAHNFARLPRGTVLVSCFSR